MYIQLPVSGIRTLLSTDLNKPTRGKKMGFGTIAAGSRHLQLLYFAVCSVLQVRCLLLWRRLSITTRSTTNAVWLFNDTVASSRKLLNTATDWDSECPSRRDLTSKLAAAYYGKCVCSHAQKVSRAEQFPTRDNVL